MSGRSFTISDELQSYVWGHSTPPDKVMAALVEETRRALPDAAVMQVAVEQAHFLRFLTAAMGVRQAVEVGTFTGMSSLSIARGLAPQGRLSCFDISDEYTSVARRYWAEAGVDDRIDLRIGPAGDNIQELPDEPYLDLVFIDADKGGYRAYWEALVPRVRVNGLLLVDNTLWSGRVLDPQGGDDHAIVAFNDMVAADPRIEVVILPIADGITMARKI